MVARVLAGLAVLAAASVCAGAQGKPKGKCKTEASVSGKHVPPDNYSGSILLSRDSHCKDGEAQSGASTDATTDARVKSTGGAKGGVPATAVDPLAFPEELSRNGGELQQRVPAAADRGAEGGLPSMPTEAVPDPPASSMGRGGLAGASSSRSSGSSSSGSSSSGSSSSGGVSSSRDAVDPDSDVAPTVADPSGPVKAGALEDLGSAGESTKIRAKLDATRLQDDLNVGRYSLKDGNAQGAYMRFTDALAVAPEDADAHFGLAQAALKLGKRDEASLHFRETLRLDPEGDNDKAARKALAGLGAKVQ